MLERLNTNYPEAPLSQGSAIGDFVSASARTMAQPLVGVSQVLHESPLHLPQLEIDQADSRSLWSKAGVLAGTAVDFVLASKCVKTMAKLPSETSRLASALELGATGALYEGVSPVDSHDTNFLKAKLSHVATGFGTMFTMGLSASALDKTKLFGIANSRTFLQEASLQGLSGAVAGISNANLEALGHGKTASFEEMGSAAWHFGLFGATLGSMQNIAGKFRAETVNPVSPATESPLSGRETLPSRKGTSLKGSETSVNGGETPLTAKEIPPLEPIETTAHEAAPAGKQTTASELAQAARKTSASVHLVETNQITATELVSSANEIAPLQSSTPEAAVAEFKPSFPRTLLTEPNEIQLYKGSPTEEAIDQSNMFLSSRTLFGRMRDGIHLNSAAESEFTLSGTLNRSQYASVAFDESKDPILRSFIQDAHSQLGHLADNPPALVEQLGRYVARSLNAEKLQGEQLMDWTEKFLSEHKGETLAAGEFVRQGKAMCEQWNAFLKKLGDSFNLKSRLRDGYVARDGGEFQRHMWTEFDFGENNYRIFDPAQATYNVPVKDVYPNSLAPGYAGPVYKPHGRF